MLRTACLGWLLALLCAILAPASAFAQPSMSPNPANEPPRAAAPSAAAPRAAAPPPAGTPSLRGEERGQEKPSGKPRNPYDMDTLRRFDAGSHRQS